MTRILFFFVLTLFSSTVIGQERSALEADRLEILQKIEKTEKDLLSISRKKETLLKEIARIESGATATDTEATENEEVDDNLLRLIELNQSPAVESEPDEPASFATTSDFSELMKLQENLLRDKVRADQLHSEGYKETGKLVDAMIRERHLNQLTTHINERQAEGLESPRETEIEEIVEPEPAPEPEISTTAETLDPEEASLESIEKLFLQVSELTDEEGKVRLLKNELEIEQESINLQLDAVLRQASTFGQETGTASISRIGRSRGFLPWPIQSAEVTERFGPQNSSGSRSNSGIKMTSNDTSVTCIYDGEVEKIITGGDGLKTVIIRHDDRTLSHYLGLKSIQVEEKQVVSQSQQLGECTGNLELEIWLNNSPQNPLHWLQNN